MEKKAEEELRGCDGYNTITLITIQSEQEKVNVTEQR